MAKCKICGDIMTDEAYAMNNGMCELCMRSSLGEDDPIIVEQAAPVETLAMDNSVDSVWARMREEEEKEKFHPAEFEGKSIAEFKFPKFISSSVVKNFASPSGEALLLTTHQPMDTFDIVISVIIGLFLFPFVAPGLFLIGILCYAHFGGFVDGLTGQVGPTIFLIIFACIWNVVIFGMVWNLLVRRLYIFDWMQINDKCIECCCSHEFDSKKAKRYDFRDINVHLEKKEGNKSNRYWIEISNKDSNSGVFSKSFKMEVKNEREGKYWEDFLKWYIWQCCGGRKHGKHA